MSTKLGESTARILALRVAADKHNGIVSMSEIKDTVPAIYRLSEADLEPSPTRNGEEHWQQIVGNVVSHRDSATSIFSQGFAIYHSDIDSIEITTKGRAYLKSLGY